MDQVERGRKRGGERKGKGRERIGRAKIVRRVRWMRQREDNVVRERGGKGLREQWERGENRERRGEDRKWRALSNGTVDDWLLCVTYL